MREPDPPRLPDEEPLPNPDENDEPPQHAEPLDSRWRRGSPGKRAAVVAPLLVLLACAGCIPPSIA